MKVSEIMNKVLVIDKNEKVKEAAKIMAEHNIGCLVIMEKNKIIGIITERDIIKNMDKLEKKVSKIMSKNVVVVDYDESIDNAALIMKKHKIKKLPVVKDDELYGIITSTDIIENSEDLNEQFFFD